jgi:uncharacterized protein (TIGR03086 family)
MRSPQLQEQDLVASFGRAAGAVSRLIAGVQPDQWQHPTPCSEWDVRQLAHHLISGNVRFAALLRGQPAAGDTAERDTDCAAAYRDAAAWLQAAFSAPGALEQIYRSPAGPAPGGALVRLRISEHLLHGWDLAQATGQRADLPEDLTAEAQAQASAQLASAPGEMLPFGPPQPVPGDAAPIDRLAALFGRCVPFRAAATGRVSPVS